MKSCVLLLLRFRYVRCYLYVVGLVLIPLLAITSSEFYNQTKGIVTYNFLKCNPASESNVCYYCKPPKKGAPKQRDPRHIQLHPHIFNLWRALRGMR